MTDSCQAVSQQPVRRSLTGMFGRFLLSGAFNTAATYVLYLFLFSFLSYRISYTISFAAGIIIAYLLNRYFVFDSHGGLKTVALFPLVYLVQYLTGIGIVSLWVEVLGWNAVFAPIAAIVFTIPLTFIMSRLVFVRQNPSSEWR